MKFLQFYRFGNTCKTSEGAGSYFTTCLEENCVIKNNLNFILAIKTGCYAPGGQFKAKSTAVLF